MKSELPKFTGDNIAMLKGRKKREKARIQHLKQLPLPPPKIVPNQT